jgi:hypothetical protein
MPVVSNTSPLNYLVLIGEIEILPALHHHVVIPVAVSEELHDPATPDAVRGWIENPPGWLEIRRPTEKPHWHLSPSGDTAHADIHARYLRNAGGAGIGGLSPRFQASRRRCRSTDCRIGQWQPRRTNTTALPTLAS